MSCCAKRRAVIFDIDSTLADANWRSGFAKRKEWDTFYEKSELDASIPQMKMIQIGDNADAFIITGRPEKYREMTEKWLSVHFKNLSFKAIFMHPDESYIKDTDFKVQKIKEIENQGYYIYAIFEDRKRNVDAFRKEGWFVFDVGGNTF